MQPEPRNYFKEGRHVGLDLNGLLMEGLFVSIVAENIGAMILGAALFPILGIKGILFPLVANAFGLIASIAGVLKAKNREARAPFAALNSGYYVTTVLAIIGFYIAVEMLLEGNLMLFAAGVVGIVSSVLFVYIARYYTEYKYRPVQSISKAGLAGSVTTIISGFAIGLEAVAGPMIVISAALSGSYYLGANAGLAGVTRTAAGLYGTAIATMGMLSTAAYILAMDIFGPLTDNARGIVEMSHQSEEIRTRTDDLRVLGHTTKAITRGYSTGTGALVAFVLVSAYINELKGLLHKGSMTLNIDVGYAPLFAGALLGARLIYLFSSFAMKAVRRAAQTVLEEVRRQFRANAFIVQGTADPDYGICTDFVTKSALKTSVVPGLLAVVSPVAVGLVFRLFAGPNDAFPVAGNSVAAFLIVGTVCGTLLATAINYGGGAWDSAKKFIDIGAYHGNGSGGHKAGVVGDIVANPFKGMTAPALEVLITLLITIALVAAPLFI